jgi:hypothetical protein
MPSGYLSRLLGTKENVTSISAFQADIYELQMKDEKLQMIQRYMPKNWWPPELSQSNKIISRCWKEEHYKTKINFKCKRNAQYLPEKYHKKAMCEPQSSIFGGHAILKTYLKVSTSYFWQKMLQNIDKHKYLCIRSQQRKKSCGQYKKMMLTSLNYY